MTRPRFPASRSVPRSLVLLACALLLGACAPRATTPADTLDTPEARQLEGVATEAFHRMEIGLLQTGAYTTNALIDLALPQGVRWTLEEFSAGSYLLRFTAASVPEYAWLVSPSGVRSVASGG